MLEYFFAQAFIIAVLLIYILLFCVPAFIIIFRGNDPFSDGASCLSFLICLIGFPGYFFGTVAWLIKDTAQEKKRKALQAEKEKQAKIDAEKQAIEAEHAKQEQRKFIDHYKYSKHMPDLMKFLRKHGTPNEIKIYFDRIEMVYHGGVDTYDFLTHSINRFIHPNPKEHKYNTSKLYYLGCAINEEFGGRFSVYEYITSNTVECNDDYVIYRNLQYVMMTRDLQDF